jgi:molybdopterin molybdotransferase
MSDSLISIEQALGRVIDAVLPLSDEGVEVGAALGRVLAHAVEAASDVPPFACSAMDGFALTAGAAGQVLAVEGESRAGTPAQHELRPGTAMRISTGAAIPAGATAVIPQENVVLSDGQIKTTAEVLSGANVRDAGEDMRRGARVLAPGTRLGPAELGAAVSAGAAQLRVARRPAVRLFCTGDELRAPGEPLGPGEIHNSNGPMLTALAERCGASAGPAITLGDDRAGTESALGAALESSDLVVVSGGVSVGPHDHVKPALAQLGVEEVFWGVALQPGKPTFFGRRADRLVFGLPGNPVSAFVTFTLFVAPALAAMLGTSTGSDGPREAVLGQPVRRNPHRTQAVRVTLEYDGTSALAIPTGPQASHIVTSLVGADALAMVPAGEGELAAGARVGLTMMV